MTTSSAELDLSAGTYVKGIALNETTFLATTQFAQLRIITRDPDVLQPNSKRGSEDPDIMGERAIHELIQRAMTGNKKTNVASYQRYIQDTVTNSKPGVLPPMHLWSEQPLDVVVSGITVYMLVPNGEHLLAIDGETQLASHHSLGRLEGNETLKQAHRKWPLSAVIHHGVSTSDARQYFYDLNVLAVRPNVSLSLGMNTKDPVMAIVDDVTASSEILAKRVERMARQLPRKSDKVVTLTNLRQMVITVAKGISGIQFGARPMPTEGVDMDELRTVARSWIPAYFATFPVEIVSRETSLAGAGSVLAAVGAIGRQLLLVPADERPKLQARLLQDLQSVDWAKGERWNGIAGGWTGSGVFSVKGTKEVAYSVHTALSDPDSPSYNQVRGIKVEPNTAPAKPPTAVGDPTPDLDSQLASLDWNDDASDA